MYALGAGHIISLCFIKYGHFTAPIFSPRKVFMVRKLLSTIFGNFFSWEGRGRAYSMWHPSSLKRDWTHSPAVEMWSLNHWTPRELSFWYSWVEPCERFPLGYEHIWYDTLPSQGTTDKEWRQGYTKLSSVSFYLNTMWLSLDFKSDKCGLQSEHASNLYWLWKCCTQYASKFGKLSSGHRTGKGQFSSQSQRKAMPKNAQTTAKLHSSHTLVK